MINTTQEKLNIPVWISLAKACELLNLKEKTVKDKCRNAEFIYRVIQSKRKSIYYIKFASLPEKIQNRFFNKQVSLEETSYSDAPDWAKAQKWQVRDRLLL